jgi:hypothetical protein
MSSSPDNDADADSNVPADSLEKLLRLKRYEQPPPRYFKDFSGQVLGRIEAGEARLSWWEKFGFDLRPAFAAAAGMAACVLVVYGVATSEGGEINGSGMSFGNPASPEPAIVFAATDPAKANSTNPVVTYGTPADRNFFGAQVTPASYPH